MTREIRVHPAAEADIDAAAAYLDEQTPGAGNAFVVAVGAAMRNARRGPRTGSLVEGTGTNLEVRRMRVRPNDYQIIFMVQDDHVLVVAVAHNKRNPLYWAARLPE